MLVVMMLIVVATSTGIWALQSTVFEQKASVSYLHSNLTRAEAECGALAGVASEEMGVRQPADAAWTGRFLTKYYLPALTAEMDTPPLPAGAGSYSCGADTLMRPAPWTMQGPRLHESIPYTDRAGRPASLVIITAYGELSLTNDPLDSNNVRGVNEVIAVSRAYFDTSN